MMNKTYHSYSEIESIPDRLHWLRHSKGLMQREAAQITGVTCNVYTDIEGGITQHLTKCLLENLSSFYAVPAANSLDEYNRFLSDGQVKLIRAYQNALGMGRKPFCRSTGIHLTSLRGYEDGKKRSAEKTGRCTS